MIDSIGYTSTTGAVSTYDSGNTMEKEDFLKLLTTQLRYQDPMEPTKNEEMAAQLAQFSSLEEITNMRIALENSVESNAVLTQAIQGTMATTLIGKQVNSAPSTVYLEESGESVDIPITLVDPASRVTIEILDANDNVIRTITETDLDDGPNVITWDGEGEYGSMLLEGNYKFNVSAVDTMGNTVVANPYIEGDVEGVVYEDGNIYVTVNGFRIPFTSIMEITESEEIQGG